MHQVTLDFETYSLSDLKTVGVRNYARHESTEILCLAYDAGDEISLWTPDLPFPMDLREWIEAGAELVAFNCQFERLIWNWVGVPKYDFPRVQRHQWVCSQARALAGGLASSLDGCGKLLKLESDEMKDEFGHRRMMRVCKPWKEVRLTPESHPEVFESVWSYCIAKGTPVLTDQGWVPIEDVKEHLLVHDGVEFVSCSGAVCNGWRETIECLGVRATADHLFLTTEGWRTAHETVERGLAGWRPGTRDPRNVKAPGVPYVDQYAGAVPQTNCERLREVRGEGRRCLREVEVLVSRFLGGYGGLLVFGGDNRPDRQLRMLLPGELPVGDPGRSGQQQDHQRDCRHALGRVDDGATLREDRCQSRHTTEEAASWGPVAEDCATHRRAKIEEVYDLVNCGPRARFVVLGRGGPVVVHNCRQDVVAEKAIDSRAPEFPPSERVVWDLTNRINERGVPLDRKFAEGGVKIFDILVERSKEQLSKLTDGRIDSHAQTKRINEWLEEQGSPLENLQRPTVEAALSDPFLSAPVRELLQIRLNASAAAPKKFHSALAYAQADDRMRYTLRYHSASTGRFSGTGPQLQNLARTEGGISPEIVQAIREGDFESFSSISDSPMYTLSKCVRGMVAAKPGYKLVDLDFSAIEARALAWVAGDTETCQKFADGADLYKELASEIYGIPEESIEKKSTERFVGKLSVLGLGYGLGANGFYDSLVANGIDVEKEFAQSVVEIYRSKFELIPKLWRELERAAFLCVKNPRTKEICGEKFVLRLEGDYLKMRLPSGRWLHYLKPWIGEGMYSNEAVLYRSNKGIRELSPPILVENLVQASARDMLVEAMLEAEKEGLFTVLTVHDSILLEEPEDRAEDAYKKLLSIMHNPPKWAEGMPLAAEGSICDRMS